MNRLQFRSAQFRYAMVYVAITFCALLFLNIHNAKISEEIFSSSKKTAMLEKCKLASAAIAELGALNPNTAEQAISAFENLNASRIIITDASGLAIYDSFSQNNNADQYILYPEIISASSGNDIFYWNFRNSMIRSTAATPIYSHGTLIGSIYLMEYDQLQGVLFSSLQSNILIITLALELVVLLFSLIFSSSYTRRLNRIMTSIRTVREGDYSHKLQLGGSDDLSVLGNEFNDLISRLQISEMKRSRFVSDASHELKTPLASIKLLTDSILNNEMDAETIREFVSDIGSEADRLNRMSQKLLTLSRIDDHPAQDYEIINIIPTADRVLRLLQSNAEANDINIIRNYITDTPIFIHEDDMFQILFNLVENGIKYNRPSGTLTLTLDRKGEEAIIKVSDSGMGIPEESQPHIFERFYRVDKARSRSTGGSGLGLSIVRNLVERNHGRIQVISTIEQGTEFTITFPVVELQEEGLCEI